MGKKLNSKYTFIELLRIVAAFLVIVNHTNSDIFLSKEISLTWLLSLSYFFVSKMAVPVFVIISGYLMLNRTEGIEKSIKRFVRMLLVILLFSLIYYIDSVGLTGFSIKDYLVTILGSSITNAFWYIYFYAGVLLMMPFLQKLFNSLEKKELQVFFGFSALIYMIWPIVVHYIPSMKLSSNFEFSLFEPYICLLFLGGYIRKYGLPKIKSIIYILVFVTCLIFNVVATYFEYRINPGWYLFYDNREFLPIVLQSICIFGIFSKITLKDRVASVVKMIGGCTFGIYLLSDFFIEKLRFIYNALCEIGIYSLIAVFIFEIVVFSVGFAITLLLKKVPYIKSLI